ncbi:MAG: ABC-F family ATP-binding cassette domain-containing protein [Bacteroidales bacterium]|nr:ABC-F family ATP-binding cassette domain-containing protein [Bacteroidales bacterium]
MAIFLQIENLTKSYGDRLLFGDVTFGINEGDKIGLIAKNGTGKTTLLRCIAGIEPFDSGKITARTGLKIGYLEQTPDLRHDLTVAQICIQNNPAVLGAISAYEDALATGEIDAISRATELMDAARAWDYEDRLKQMLTQLGIANLNQPVGELSGGQRKRVALAKVILDEPQLIILDEPTNHLDIPSIEWLESYLSRAKVALLMVTHDRYFLDRVCDKIIEIDLQQIFTYSGNYAYYLRKRQERIDAMGAELSKVRNTLRKEQEWMNRQPQARAGKAKYRIDAFYDLKKRAAVDLRERNVDLSVKSSYIGNKIFEAKNISKKFGDKVILNDFNYIFARYEKVGIVGKNGVGKSTFIKLLQGIIPSDSGTWDIGETVRFGYYNQDGIDFNPEKKVIDAITEIAEDIVVNDGTARFSPSQFLQHFLFTPPDQQKLISKLSGGERSRLYLASVLMRSPNFLILDEPTNDLDIVTLGILEEYLASFKGCAIIISHDRYFLDNIVDHIFVLEGDGIVKDFPGGYTDYREWKQQCEEDEKTQKALEEEKKRKTVQQTEERNDNRSQNRPAKLTFKEKREYESLTLELEKINNEIAELEAEFNSGEAIENIEEKSRRYTALKEELDEKELRWLELSEKV